MRNRCSVLTDLFLSFAKVGCFTFGGGYSMISVITDTCVEKKKWISHDEMMNVTVIAESTPGPIAINCATYVGYKLAGMAGAVVATLGIVVPSFVIIYLISNFLDNFLAYPLVAKAFLGIKVGVGILILDAGLTMLRKNAEKAAAPHHCSLWLCGYASDQHFFSEDFFHCSYAGCGGGQSWPVSRKGRA